MGKYIIPLLIIFIACLILGYCTTGDLVRSKTPTPQPADNSDQPVFQINLIMVDVDDLTKRTPDLLSVWGVFLQIDQNNSMEIAYKPLYPVPDSPNINADIENLFSVDKKNGLSPQFLQYLADKYSFPWDNYIAIDYRAITILSDWITGIPADIQTDKPQNTEEQQNLVEEQGTLLLDICQSLPQEGLQNQTSLNWKKLIPVHFLTNQPEKTLLDNWLKITKAAKPSRCNIILK